MHHSSSQELKKTAGGSAIFVKNNLKSHLLKPPTFTTAEAVCVEIEMSNGTKIVVCQIYRAPNTNKIKFREELEQCLKWLYNLRKLAYVIGDLNFDLFNINVDQYAQDFFTLMCSYGFFPTISKTTRFAGTSSTLIDNIFCNNLNLIKCSGIVIDDLSDHFPIFNSVAIDGVTSHEATSKCGVQVCFNYRRIEEMKEFLRQKLCTTLHETDPELIAAQIIAAYQEGLAEFSFAKPQNRKTSPRKPWITPAILASINRKNELFYLKLKKPTQENIANYSTYRNILKMVLKSAKQQYYAKEFRKNHGNSKKTWSTVSELMGNKSEKSGAPKEIRDNDKLATDSKDIARVLNKYFSEVGLQLKANIPNVDCDPLELIEEVEHEMCLNATTENEIEEIVKGLNDVGAGYDKINSKIFKSTFHCILDVLLHFFNLCLSSAIFPSTLKVAVIKPVHKAGDSKEPNNYRPISMLPYISKILEKLICNRLDVHLSDHSILSNQQFGFRKEHSTYMPILVLQNIITESFENGDQALGLYLDLRKAFDTVNIELLLQKLEKYGIRNKSLDIITSYLHGRKQCVRINDDISDYEDIVMGVPQGSILGPVLFSLYINDAPNISPKMTCLLYADDTAIIFRQKTKEELQDVIHEVMPKLSLWFSANYLSLNVSKTFIQHYSTSPPPQSIKVVINNAVIKEKDEVKYLGVLIDKSLKFTSHIKGVVNTISRNIGIISRIRYCIDNKTTYLLYNSMILPYINYCCLIWGINYESQLQRLIILQKRAVRLIVKIYPPASSQPLFKEYKILKIDQIAKMQMILVVHRFLKSELPASLQTLFEKETGTRVNRNRKHVKEPFSNRNYRLFTTTLKGPKLWNTILRPLYPTIDQIPRSKDAIKNICRKHFLNNN